MKRKLGIVSLFVPFGFMLLGFSLIIHSELLSVLGYAIIFIGSIGFGSFLRLKK